MTDATSSPTSPKRKDITFYLVRHGKTILNTLGRVQGWADAVLTPAGEERVIATGLGLKDIPFQNIYSSDSGRAVQTAEIIAAQNVASPGLEVLTDWRLREFNFGSYEGEHSDTMHEDIAAAKGIGLEEYKRSRTPQMVANTISQLDLKKRGKNTQNRPAEDYRAIESRLAEVLNLIVDQESERDGSGNILVVSHGLSITAILALTEKTTRYSPPDGIENASVSTVAYHDGHYMVQKVNDMSYAETGEALIHKTL